MIWRALALLAVLTPEQTPGEESDAPKALAKALGLQSVAPTVPRAQRKSRGRAELRFSPDLSSAHVEVEITGVAPSDMVMLHIHSGPPGVMGPVVADLGTKLVSGKLSAELRKKNLTGAKSIAELESLARRGFVYFDLHTKAHMFYGEIRGQVLIN